MINAKVTRALLSVLVLGCVPALAANPSDPSGVQLILGNAKMLDTGHYAVQMGETVAIGAIAGKGDMIGVYAVPLLGDGTIDYKNATELLFDKAATFGYVSGKFVVPKYEGQTYLLFALAMNAKGDVAMAAPVKIEIRGPDAAPALKAQPTEKIESEGELDLK